MIAWDTETFLIAPAMKAPPLVCVSWASSPKKHGLIHVKEPRCKDAVQGLLRTHSILANAPFDLAVVGAQWPDLIPDIFTALAEDRIHDVLTREKLLDICRGSYRWDEDEDGNPRRFAYSLQEVTYRRTGVWLEKDEFRMRYHDFIDTPLKQWPEGARKYAINDALATLKVWEAQEKLAKYMPDRFAQERAHWALYLMSCWGIKTDMEAVKRLEARAQAELEEVVGELTTTGLVREDRSRDTKKAKARMLDVSETVVITKKGMDRVRDGELTKQEAINEGYISLSRDACLFSGDKVLMKYSRYSQLQNLLRGAVKDLKRGAVTPIQSRFEVLMESGRTSSSGPNIQNPRREPGVRECFVPRAGNVFVTADFGAAELVSLAQVCLDKFGKSALADAINNGIDPHLWMGAHLLQMSYEEAKQKLAEEKRQNESGQVSQARQMAKAANFGFPGGLGIKRFVGYAQGYGLDIDHHFAAKLKRLWLRTWPEMERYFKWINDQSTGDWIYLQQHRSNRIRGKMTFTQAANTLFQGLTADGAKAALWEVARRQYTVQDSALYGTRTVNFVHDEIIIECDEKIAHDVAIELCEVMIEQYNRFTPDVPVDAEPTVMRFWSKKAKLLWASNDDRYKGMDWRERARAGDRLIPWPKAA